MDDAKVDPITSRYLGDGVYASWDGYHITLDLRGQDTTTRIALEPQVMQMLSQFKRDTDAKRSAVVDILKGGE